MVNCVYIHIPFCEKKCNYCSFCSHSLLKYQDEYVESLIKEIKFLYKNEPLKTIYFGGGTPSLINVENIEKILSCLKFNSDTQITLEINPNTVSKDKLIAYKRLGINRLSIGMQSAKEKELKLLGNQIRIMLPGRERIVNDQNSLLGKASGEIGKTRSGWRKMAGQIGKMGWQG